MGTACSIRNGRRGFTLIETVVAIGMVAILLLIMTAQATLAFRSMRSSDLAAQLVQTENEIQLILEDSNQCTINLLGKVIPPVGSPGTPVTKIREYTIVPYVENEDWTYCSGEFEQCNFVGARRVRYGISGRYVYRNLKDGAICGNEVFGDPAVGMQKQCFTGPVPPPPNPEQNVVREIAIEGQAVLGLTSKEMVIKTVSQISATQAMAELEVKFHGIEKETAPVIRRFPIYVVMSDSKLTQCAARSESSWLMSEKMCSMFENGYYDAVTNSCQFPAYKWVSGDERTARCGPNDSLGDNPTKYNCDAEAPAGWHDWGGPSASRTYADGSVLIDGPGAMEGEIDIATKTCTCTYAVGINPAGWKCKIKCLGQASN